MSQLCSPDLLWSLTQPTGKHTVYRAQMIDNKVHMLESFSFLSHINCRIYCDVKCYADRQNGAIFQRPGTVCYARRLPRTQHRLPRPQLQHDRQVSPTHSLCLSRWCLVIKERFALLVCLSVRQFVRPVPIRFTPNRKALETSNLVKTTLDTNNWIIRSKANVTGNKK